MLKRILQSLLILKLTNFKYYRAKQLEKRRVKYSVAGYRVALQGNSILSMLKEIVLEDSYHLKVLKNPKNIMDIGANVGVFSIYASILYPKARILAFEPDKQNYLDLRTNTKAFSNIECYNYAIGKENGYGSLSSSMDNTAYTLNTIVTSDNLCEIMGLKDALNLLKEGEWLDLMKLDCEGSEYEILSLSIENVKSIAGEYHIATGRSLAKLKQDIQKNNFKIIEWRDFPLGNAGIFFAQKHQDEASNMRNNLL
jgi:FkbM family methyltransferase